jgi:carbon monoxide dehydrogenase subunit G
MRITVSTQIDAPPAVVWEDVADLESHADWMADAHRVSVISNQSTGVGTVLEVPTGIGPFRTTDWIIVTGWVDGRSIEVVHVGLVSGQGEFRLEPSGTGTRFVWDETLSLPMGFGGRVGEAIAKPVIESVWRGNLRRLENRFRGA